MRDKDRLICGTKATESRGASDFRSVCATCGAGGTICYKTLLEAFSAVVRNSNQPCRTCGAS